MKKNNFENRKLAISELADAAGVTIRTIRYYIKEGLLPPPKTQGRYALYDSTYLNRLELIRRWKDSYLPLKEIRARVQPLSDHEVEMLLVNAAAEQDELLGEQPLMDSKEKGISFSKEGPEGGLNKKGGKKSKKDSGEKNAATYARQVREGKQEEVSDAAEYSHRIRRQQALPVPIKPRVYPRHQKQHGEEWRHIRVMPGFELHLSEGMYRQYDREIQELLTWISQKFGNLRNRT